MYISCSWWPMKMASVYLYDAQSEVHGIDGYHLVDGEV